MLEKAKGKCNWFCWGSYCGNEGTEEDGKCKTHTGACIVCEKETRGEHSCEVPRPSTMGCGEHWGPGICGAPLCEEHKNQCPMHPREKVITGW